MQRHENDRSIAPLFRHPGRNHLAFVWLALLSATVVCLNNTGNMSQRSGSIDIRNLQDRRTPVGEALSGIYKQSFAYLTLKDRLPIILTKVVDTLSRNKELITQAYGPNATEEIKKVVGAISKLKNEIVTNKSLKPLEPLRNAPDDDTDVWNRYFEKRTEIEGETPMWFNTVWLYCECYMYRRLAQEFLLTDTLQKYDPFEEQKKSGFTNSINSIQALANYTMNLVNKKNMSESETKEAFVELVKVNLWGNRCDLSLSAGAESDQSGNPTDLLQSFDDDILVNDTEYAWNVLKTKKSNNADKLDIVLDNAGYELFTDICLAAFLTARGLTQQVRFYVKRYPWYVSDVTFDDFHWTIDYMKNSSNSDLRAIGELSSQHLQNNTWTVEREGFWTSPYNFTDMKREDPSLYAKLSEAKLVIFKGDLNYRKLLADINWDYTTPFCQALMEFQPTNVLSLRTVKSDVCVGLPAGKAEVLFEINEKWMFTGQYGLIQANIHVNSQCPRS